MSASTEYVRHVTELMAPLGRIEGSKFFGGHGMKQGGRQFAMVMGNTLYFRVSDATRPGYESMGSRPFSYATSKGTVKVRKYFAVPEALFDDTALLLSWARQAIDAAGRP